jgi:hypothetical protein
VVTDEAAHSGRFSLKWDLSKVADPKSTGRDPRWLVVNVRFDPETVKSLRGKRVKVGYWMRLGGAEMPIWQKMWSRLFSLNWLAKQVRCPTTPF